MRNKLITCIIAVILCTGFLFVPVFASDGGGEILTVNAAWVDGDMLRINVTDANGVNSALALRLSDYMSNAEDKEYIAIQAVDLAGNKSGVIEIKNPYYKPKPSVEIEFIENPAESAVPNGKPFTPDGSGTVLDNVHDGDGKEFFTIDTEDGSVFYLIVDRQRTTDNVYLLNLVTLEDLVALAEKDGKTIDIGSTSAISVPEQDMADEQTAPKSPTPEQTAESPDKPQSKKDISMYIIIGIAVIAVGGAGYYFKIVRGKNKKDVYDYEKEDDSEDYDDYGDEPEDGGDEE